MLSVGERRLDHRLAIVLFYAPPQWGNGDLEMTRLALIFSLLFATPAWAENVDGNSFLCYPDKNSMEYDVRVVEFRRGFLGSRAFLYNGERMLGKSEYRVDPGYVRFWPGLNLYHLNRKTLRLTLGDPVYCTDESPYECHGYYDCSPMEVNEARRVAKSFSEEKDRKLREGNRF